MSDLESINKRLDDLTTMMQIMAAKLDTLRFEKEEAPVEESDPLEVWKPKEDEEYRYIDHDGSVGSDYHDNGCYDEAVNLGNCFKTEEEAELVSKKMWAYARLLKQAMKFKSFACNATPAWEITWHRPDSAPVVVIPPAYHRGVFRFADQADADKFLLLCKEDLKEFLSC